MPTSVSRTSGVGQVSTASQTDVRVLKKTLEDIQKNGARIEKSTDGNYYVRADLQNSAAAGAKSFKVDAKLAQAILKAEGSGGVTSRKEIATKILPNIVDGGRYGAGEQILARLLLSAVDDRKSVKLNGTNINLTTPAEKDLKHELHSFWGTLGAKERWGKQEVIKPDVASMKKTSQAILSKGAKIEEKNGKYYVSANIQNSAASGTHKYQVDAALAKAILKGERSGGVTSLNEVATKILPNILDGGRYGEGEAVLVRMLLAAGDDRKNVVLNGKKIDLTNPAEAAFRTGMQKFWGKLGADARWNN